MPKGGRHGRDHMVVGFITTSDFWGDNLFHISSNDKPTSYLAWPSYWKVRSEQMNETFRTINRSFLTVICRLRFVG
jgi:hypothetical protein